MKKAYLPGDYHDKLPAVSLWLSVRADDVHPRGWCWWRPLEGGVREIPTAAGSLVFSCPSQMEFGLLRASRGIELSKWPPHLSVRPLHAPDPDVA